MAVVAVDFTHFDLTCKAGDELPDDHELVELAPHLFVQPDPPVVESTEPVRLGRDNLVNPDPPKSPKSPKSPKKARP